MLSRAGDWACATSVTLLWALAVVTVASATAICSLFMSSDTHWLLKTPLFVPAAGLHLLLSVLQQDACVDSVSDGIGCTGSGKLGASDTALQWTTDRAVLWLRIASGHRTG